MKAEETFNEAVAALKGLKDQGYEVGPLHLLRLGQTGKVVTAKEPEAPAGRTRSSRKSPAKGKD